MADEDPIPFPHSGRTIVREPHHEIDLFGSLAGSRGKVVFLDIEEWTEDKFLGVLTRNAVATLVDLRPRPIFRAPHYRHKVVVSHMRDHSILYVEAALLDGAAGLGTSAVGAELSAQVLARLGSGLTILIHDDAAKRKGWLLDVRAGLRVGSGNWTELHPSALA
jgi:hypothetical protein